MAKDEDFQANARLISAAPDLLEACKYLLRLAELEQEHCRLVVKDEAIKQAQQAIAKAEGK